MLQKYDTSTPTLAPTATTARPPQRPARTIMADKATLRGLPLPSTFSWMVVVVLVVAIKKRALVQVVAKVAIAAGVVAVVVVVMKIT